MQIARPHTRFFRLVYDSPKQSDILCGINIRIHIVSAISALERLVSSCADMVAHRASLRSICWLHDNQGYTRHPSLVFHKGAELMEAPRIEFQRDMVLDTTGHKWKINSYKNDILVAGCHRIAYSEMKGIARQLGWD